MRLCVKTLKEAFIFGGWNELFWQKRFEPSVIVVWPRELVRSKDLCLENILSRYHMVIRPLENFLRDQEVHRLQTFEVKNGLFLQEISTQKMDFGVQILIFQKSVKKRSRYLGLSKIMFPDFESDLKVTLGVINTLFRLLISIIICILIRIHSSDSSHQTAWK